MRDLLRGRFRPTDSGSSRKVLGRRKDFRLSGEEGDEASSVDGLYDFIVLYSGHFKNGGKEIFDDNVIIATGLRLHLPGP